MPELVSAELKYDGHTKEYYKDQVLNWIEVATVLKIELDALERKVAELEAKIQSRSDDNA